MAVELAEASFFDASPAWETTELPELVSFAIGPDTRGTVILPEATEYIAASVSLLPQQTTLQKVWDSVAGDWVLWATDAIDYDGTEYPGPGVWGAQTSNFRIQNIKFTRV